MRILALALAGTTAMLAATSAFAHGSVYRSADGTAVHAPYLQAHAGETAICRDGRHSMSRHRSGTCSGHGGVAVFEH